MDAFWCVKVGECSLLPRSTDKSVLENFDFGEAGLGRFVFQ